MKIKEVNGERSDKTTHRKKRRHHLVYPGAQLAHPSLPTASPTRQEQPAWRATYWIGLDPTQQWLICSTYMSQMVGFQCSWCRKSTQEYWSFLLSAWSPQELNIRTNLEGERWSRWNPILGWRKPWCSRKKIDSLILPPSQQSSCLWGDHTPDCWRSGLVGGRWLAQGEISLLSHSLGRSHHLNLLLGPPGHDLIPNTHMGRRSATRAVVLLEHPIFIFCLETMCFEWSEPSFYRL